RARQGTWTARPARTGVAWLAVAALATSAIAAGGGKPIGMTPGPAIPAAPRSHVLHAPLPRGSALPDTVLARVDADRSISIAAFRRSWAQMKPPTRPDSLTPQSARRFLDLLLDREVLAARAQRETWVWSPVESLQYSEARDRILLQAQLDSA